MMPCLTDWLGSAGSFYLKPPTGNLGTRTAIRTTVRPQLAHGRDSQSRPNLSYRRLEGPAKFRPLAARGSAQLLNLVQHCDSNCMHSGTVSMQCMPRGRRRAGPRQPAAAAHRGPRPLHILAEAHPGQSGDGRRSPMTQGFAINRPFSPEPLPLECRAAAVLRSQGISRAPHVILLSACSTLP